MKCWAAAVLMVVTSVHLCVLLSECSDLTSQNQTTPIITATVGQRVVLPCRTSESGPVDFAYQRDQSMTDIAHDGKLINGYSDGERYEILIVGINEYNLIINTATLDDAGRYLCTEKSGIGSKHEMYLIVDTEANLPITNSTTLVDLKHTSPAVYFADVGQQVTLPCHSELSVGVDWNFVGELTNATSPTTHIHVCQNGAVINGHGRSFFLDTSTPGRYNLVIRQASPSDSGTFTCTENAGLGRQHSISLKVFDFNKSKRYRVVTVGADVTFACRFNSSSGVRWNYYRPHSVLRNVLYNGHQLSSNTSFAVYNTTTRSVLRKEAVQLGDAGTYDCTPQTSALQKHTFDLTVLASKPNCAVFPGYEVRVGQRLEVSCSVDFSGNLKTALRCSLGAGDVIAEKHQTTLIRSFVASCDQQQEFIACAVDFYRTDASESSQTTAVDSSRWTSKQRLTITGNCQDVQISPSHQMTKNSYTLSISAVVISGLTLSLLVIAALFTVVVCKTKWGRQALSRLFPHYRNALSEPLIEAGHSSTDSSAQATTAITSPVPIPPTTITTQHALLEPLIETGHSSTDSSAQATTAITSPVPITPTTITTQHESTVQM